MKKLIIFLTFFLCLLIFDNHKENLEFTMVDSEDDNYYSLLFDDENLCIRNFKLKLAVFSPYENKVMKVYIKYPTKISENLKDKIYFSFDNTNMNRGIEKLKQEYTLLLKEKNVFDMLDGNIDDTKIYKLELFATKDALIKFTSKYPSVKIQKMRY